MNAVVNIRPNGLDAGIIANIVTTGDLSGLTGMARVDYYNYRCQQAGLDPAAKPFDLLKLNGKLVLYANASCTQQLCSIHKLTVEIVTREKMDDIYIVHARAKSPDGRASDNTGAVPIGGLKGEALANALMKGTTKAIRRTVLAHVGLGMLDETEVATIPDAQRIEYTDKPLEVTADPRGDLTGVDMSMRDEHVDAITEILNADQEDHQIADTLREYVGDFLVGFNDLYISVADELSARKVASKSQFKAWLKLGLNRKDG